MIPAGPAGCEEASGGAAALDQTLDPTAEWTASLHQFD